jgi:uncharacterized protein (DUF4415 family)
MKKAKPSRRVRAEIAKLAALPDRDIDFDDIPEISDWSGVVRGRFFRPVKQAISLRVDRDVLTWFKSLGGGYQSRINAVLRDYMDRTRRSSHLRRSKKALDELTKQAQELKMGY